MSIKRMNRSGLALASFVACYEFDPTFGPVTLVRSAWSLLSNEASLEIATPRTGGH